MLRSRQDLFKNKDAKLAVCLLVFNVAALLPLLCFAFPHYTGDSYLLAFHYEWHWSAFVGAYRYFGALLIWLWTRFFDPIAGPLLDMTAFILFSALAVTALSGVLWRKHVFQSRYTLITADLAVLVSVANVYLCNVLTFPECIFPLSVAVLFCFLSVCVFSSETLSVWIRYPLSGLLLICCTAVYQQFLTIFIVFGFLLTVLEQIRSDKKTAGAIIVAYVKFILFTGVCAAIYYAIGIGMQKTMHIASNPRAAFTVQSILENIRYYLTHQRSILGGKGLFRTKLLRRSFQAVFLVWCVSAGLYLRRQKPSVKNLFMFLAFPAAYISVFLVGIISETGGVRVIMGLFSVFALLSVSALALFQNKKAACCLIALLLFVFALNTYKNIQVFYDLAALNGRETMLTQQYLREIGMYEAESGNTVKNVVFGRDAEPGDCAGNAYASDWGAAGIFDYVSGGRTMNVRWLTAEEHARFFGDRNWTSFVPGEQLVFDGDTLYLCVY